MKTNLFVFSFFFIIILFSCFSLVVACTQTGPCQGGGYWCICGYDNQTGFNGTNVITVGNLTDFSIYKGDVLDFYMNYYFIGYDNIQILINYVYNDSEFIFMNMNSSSSSLVSCTNDNEYCLMRSFSGDVSYIFLRIKSVGLDKIDLVNILGENFTSGSYAEYNFNINSYSSYRPAFNNLSNYTTDPGNWFVNYGKSFRGLFPDSYTLSLSDKLSVVFITILITTLLIYISLYLLSKGIEKFHHYIVLLIDILLLLFFIGIGYIPILYLVLIVLLMVILAYFKIKGSSGG
jgi:hypothetical protein